MKILKTNEAGRSMVEMLGVLAIMGVLSVAGIAGYSIAMRSHRTNEIINAAFMLHVMATTQNAGNGADLNYRDIATVPGGANSISYSNDSKTIAIDGISQEDCLLIKDKLGDKAGECVTSGTSYVLTVTVNKTTATTTQEEEEIPDDCNEVGATMCFHNYRFECVSIPNVGLKWVSDENECENGCGYNSSEETHACKECTEDECQNTTHSNGFKRCTNGFWGEETECDSGQICEKTNGVAQCIDYVP